MFNISHIQNYFSSKRLNHETENELRKEKKKAGLMAILNKRQVGQCSDGKALIQNVMMPRKGNYF